jgi:hypothetical protein
MRLGGWPENPRAQDLRRFREKPQHLRLRLVDTSLPLLVTACCSFTHPRI